METARFVAVSMTPSYQSSPGCAAEGWDSGLGTKQERLQLQKYTQQMFQEVKQMKSGQKKLRASDEADVQLIQKRYLCYNQLRGGWSFQQTVVLHVRTSHPLQSQCSTTTSSACSIAPKTLVVLLIAVGA